MNIEAVKRLVHDVRDFPEPGIVFKDITPLLADPAAFEHTIGLLADGLVATNAEEILAIESRGFSFGAAVAARLSLPLHLVRKAGKLPRTTVGVDYALEYGTDRVEIHHDILRPGVRYAIIDDLIATGGTAAATARLVREQGATIVNCSFVIELNFLHGRAKLGDCRVDSLIAYD